MGPETLVFALLAVGVDPQPTPEACAEPSPAAVEAPLQLDIDRRVACVLAREPPRFAEQVDVRATTREVLLQRFIRPEDVRAAPTSRHRWFGTPPLFEVDVLPLILKLLGKGPPGPFYAYVLTTAHGRAALLREEPIEAAALIVPGGVYEPAGRFETLAEARSAVRELNRRAALPGDPP